MLVRARAFSKKSFRCERIRLTVQKAISRVRYKYCFLLHSTPYVTSISQELNTDDTVKALQSDAKWYRYIQIKSKLTC